MSRASRSVTVVTAASLCLLAGGLIAVNGTSPTSPAAAPSTSERGPATSPALSLESVPSTEAVPTTENSGFADAAAASLAAEHLLVPYVASQYLLDVADPACSVPTTGAIGETFACYALKPGDLVIALRATISEDQLISLELITNQEEAVESTIPVTETTTA